MEIFFILLVLMLIAAIVAVETKDLLSSVVCVGAIGFGSAVMFLFLRAPDIALTQVVVETLSLVILIRVVISRDRTFISGERELFAVVVSIIILFLISLIGAEILENLTPFGNTPFVQSADFPSRVYLENGIKNTGAMNIVTAVYLDYRVYDTLGEATVLFTSVVGAVVLLRRKSRKSLLEENFQ
jgi:multicomponent Na+:H+ antiporter subunit B